MEPADFFPRVRSCERACPERSRRVGLRSEESLFSFASYHTDSTAPEARAPFAWNLKLTTLAGARVRISALMA